MPFVDNLCCFFCNGMVTSMLEPHLASTGATTNEVGITFLVLGAIFMVSTPLAGMVIIVFVPISPFHGFNIYNDSDKKLVCRMVK
jgi:hypothetical protein